MAKPTLTLCMIVKDESHIIKECLESVSKIIDRYDITDTGSTDGTQDLIREFFEEKGIPGEVHQSDWKGFGKSRTESIENAEKSGCDLALIIDADDYLSGDLQLPDINSDIDGWTMRITRGEFTWWRTQLIRLSSNWQYVGILHEYATVKHKPAPMTARLEGNYVINARTEGNRNVGIDPIEKYTKDANLLLSALTDPEDPNYEPENGRYMFYLAQSYFDSQQWENAIEWYQKRADHGGWGEEVFYSLQRVAMTKAILEKPVEEIIHSFLICHNSRPSRAEPLYHIARIYRELLEMPAVAYLFAKRAAELPYPKQDILFITDDVYNWMALDELATCAYHVGDMHLGYAVSKKLLEENLIPVPEQRERVHANFKTYEKLVMNHQSQMYSENLAEKAAVKRDKKEKKQARKTKVKKGTKTSSRRK